MIGHVVMFKFHKRSSSEDREHALFLLRRMPEVVPSIKEWQIGQQYVYSEKRWDIVEIATFDNEEELDLFQSSSMHKELTTHMKKISDWHAVDFTY